jgi:D-3-phosphoglycerate dehydrogenase
MGICTKAGRIAIMHQNIPNTLSKFTTVVANDNVNISDMVNRSKGEYAYTMLDIDDAVSEAAVEHLKQIGGVLRVRVIR